MLELLEAGQVDQAAGLRRLFRARTGRAIAFVSGRESCGRTRLLAQTAAALARSGESVLVIDENGGDDNLHKAFGLQIGRDLLDVGLRDVAAESLIQRVIAGPGVLTAARLAMHRGELTGQSAQRLDRALEALQQAHSYILIDCADGSPQQLSPLALAAPSMAVVVAAQTTAITRAYALIKRLVRESGRESFQLVITRARSDQESQAIFSNMQRTAREHLGVRLDYLAEARQPAVDNIAGSLEICLPKGATGFRSLARDVAARARAES